MATENEKERLAVLEVKVDQQGRDLTEVKGDVKTLLSKFDIVLGLRNEIDNLKTELLAMRSTNVRNRVIYPALASIIASTLTAIILLSLIRTK